MKNFLLFIILFFALLGFSEFSFAQFNISVSPNIVKEETKARDVLEYKIKIKNLGENLYHFYTLVFNVEKNENLDKSTSLANWIEIFRGRTEIFPGQEKEIPLKVNVPYYAKPGSYFAEIVFAQGSTESDAREKAKVMNMPKVLLNIEVKEHIVEKLQVRKFQAEKNIYFNPNIKFKIELENIGNTEIETEFKILIYGKKGEEIGFLDSERKKLLPGEKKDLEVFWRAKNMGQIKAVLFGEYGKNKEKIFQDTTFVWFISWKFLILFLFLVLIVIFFLSWFFSKSLRKQYIEVFRQKKVFDVFRKL